MACFGLACGQRFKSFIVSSLISEILRSLADASRPSGCQGPLRFPFRSVRASLRSIPALYIPVILAT